MSIELYEFTGLPDALQEQFAEEISAETNSQFGAEQKIVPVTKKAILQRGIGFVALEDEVFAGYVGAINMRNGYAKVGTLVVPEQYQGSGTGTSLIAHATKQVVSVNLQPFALSNSNSQPGFEKVGYVAALPGKLPPELTHSQFNNLPMIYLRQTINNPLYAARDPNELDSSLEEQILHYVQDDSRIKVSS